MRKLPTIKVIVAGTRTFDDYELARAELNIRIAPGVFDREVIIVSGRCDDKKNGVLTFTTKEGIGVYGADGLGERYAEEYGFPVIPVPAEWGKYGKKASYIRNSKMGDIGTHCVCFMIGESKGTSMMIKIAKSKGLVTQVINV